MNVFTYQNYKTFLKDFIKRNKHKGLISQIAEVCGCDRTYISQILKGKADLLPDHMIRLTHFLNLNESESDYLLHLLLKDRANSLSSKNLFETKLANARENASEISKRVKSKKDSEEIISEEHKTLYYSNLLIPVIHTLTSIENFQTIESISKKLHCTETFVIQTLNLLEDMKLIHRSKDKFIHSGKNIYLKRDAAHIYSLHLQSRLEAVKRSFNKEDIHFTNIFTIAKEDLEVVKSQIIKLIEDQRNTVHASGSQVACVFCCDFYSV